MSLLISFFFNDTATTEIYTLSLHDAFPIYVMIKGSIQEEDITIINVYVPNIGAPQYVRQMLTTMKGEINSNTIIVGEIGRAHV